MSNEPLLFHKAALGDVTDSTRKRMLGEIDSYPGNQLLNTSRDDLATYFADKFEISPIRLLDEHARVDQHEVDIDISKLRSSFNVDSRQPHHVRGTAITLYVPFEGDANIFQYTPSTFNSCLPRGIVRDNVLEITIYRTDHDTESAKRELDDAVRKARQYLKWAERDLEPYNKSLRDIAYKRIQARHEKLLKDQSLVSALGFPLRERAGATFAVPMTRRKAVPKPPAASSAPYAPEPALAMAEYENILSIMQKTAVMLERSPDAFKGMDEETLRYQFLVPLNSHYEGQAIGETFNFTGKTDILIRQGDRSVFIAECKIWRGPASLDGAIDQLLQYATWRDTKIAILVFNRNKNITQVLNQIPAVVTKHPNFKRAIPLLGEGMFRCVLAHRDDPNRELIVTILVFEVPD
jgi:hypothetical protein